MSHRMTARDYLVCNQYRGGLERLRLAIDDHRSERWLAALRHPASGRPRLLLVQSLATTAQPQADCSQQAG
jgi:hypothetical protein